MNDAADLIRALTGLAWPLVVGIIIWRLFPSIKRIVESRGFTVKVGQAELTVQEISEKLLQTTADIQGKLASVTSPTQPPTGPKENPQAALRSILWVDDNPSNNAYEIAQLNALGVDVSQAQSTQEAVSTTQRAINKFDAIITDMGRQEASGYNTDAGIDLIRELRERDVTAPIFVYASRAAVARDRDIRAAGGNGVTASPTELFTLLRTVGPFPSAV